MYVDTKGEVQRRLIGSRCSVDVAVMFPKHTAFAKVANADLHLAIDVPDANDVRSETSMPDPFQMELIENLGHFYGEEAQVRNRRRAVRFILFLVEIDLGERPFVVVGFVYDHHFSTVWGGFPFDRVCDVCHWTSGVKV